MAGPATVGAMLVHKSPTTVSSFVACPAASHVASPVESPVASSAVSLQSVKALAMKTLICLDTDESWVACVQQV